MKFKVTLTILPNPNGVLERTLPLNYQYEFSSWIYKVVNHGDKSFAQWLHQHGYKIGDSKTFKLFSFSNLEIKDKRVEGDRLQLLSDSATIEISFMPIEAIDTFIKGLFMEQTFSIGDIRSQVWLRVSSVEALSEPQFEETMRFRAVSPVFMDLIVEGRPQPLHLAPDAEQYSRLLFANLNDKYKAFKNSRFGFDTATCRFSILGTPKRKLIAIKANTSSETRMVAFLYDFEVTAPVELLRMGYYCGFGSANSQGFGAVRVLER